MDGRAQEQPLGGRQTEHVVIFMVLCRFNISGRDKMRNGAAWVAFVVVLAVMLLPVASARCTEYVVTRSPNVNIRTGPGTDRVIIGRTTKGDIF